MKTINDKVMNAKKKEDDKDLWSYVGLRIDAKKAGYLKRFAEKKSEETQIKVTMSDVLRMAVNAFIAMIDDAEEAKN